MGMKSQFPSTFLHPQLNIQERNIKYQKTKRDQTEKDKIRKVTNSERTNLWSNHVNYLTQYILKEHRLLGHTFHSMQLLFIKELHFIPGDNSISIQIYTLEPSKYIKCHDLVTVDRVTYLHSNQTLEHIFYYRM